MTALFVYAIIPLIFICVFATKERIKSGKYTQAVKGFLVVEVIFLAILFWNQFQNSH
jgi:hypothetical protein